jgi:uncharacterized protein (TIGR00369 family)
MEENPRTRTVSWDDPAGLSAKAASVSGLEYLEGMRDGTIAHPPISILVDFLLVEVEIGRVVFEIEPAEYHLNPFSAMHGGVTCGVLDAATGCAVHSTLPPGVGYTSIDVKVNYLRPITKDTGRLRCEGRVIQVGNRLGIAEGRMTDRDGKLYAYGVSTCMIFRDGRA